MTSKDSTGADSVGEAARRFVRVDAGVPGEG